MDGIAQARATLDYAHAQLQQLLADISTWCRTEPKPYGVVSEIDFKQRQQVFRFVIFRDPPPDWAHRMRGISNDFRSALNYAIRACADPVTDEVNFPIYRVEREYRRVGKGRRGRDRRSPRERYLTNVPEHIRQVVDAWQPYQRGNDADSHPLAGLADLTNTSKHAQLGTAFVAAHGGNIVLTPLPPAKLLSAALLIPGKCLYDGMEVARVFAIDPPSGKVIIQGDASIEIAFGEPGIPASDVLSIGRDVVKIVEHLDAARRPA